MQPVSNPEGGSPSAGWRKASRSMANGNCVETAPGGGTVLVRDSADRDGPRLEFPAKAWAEFTATVKR